MPAIARAVAFALALGAIAALWRYHDVLLLVVLPVLAGWKKAVLALLRPDVVGPYLKGLAAAQTRRRATAFARHVVITSHPTPRRAFARLLVAVGASVRTVTSSLLALPLLVKVALCVGILLLTAGTGYAAFAVFLLPREALVVAVRLIGNIAHKLGVNRLLAHLETRLVPERVSRALRFALKWRLGRWQVRLARRAEASVRRRREALAAWRDIRAMACALPSDATRVAERDDVTEGS